MCKFVVNLSDVLDNFNKIKSTLDKNVKVCVVVKANAYGFGMPKIVNLLKNRADFFAVARLSEFWEYKKLKVELPCLILSPLYGNNLKVAIKNGAHITLSSSCDLTEVDSLAKKMGVVANVHLKIDTGMARFGYTSLTVIKQLLKQLKKCKNIKLFSISDNLDICADLNNYKDLTHYGPWINSLILQLMQVGIAVKHTIQ